MLCRSFTLQCLILLFHRPRVVFQYQFSVMYTAIVFLSVPYLTSSFQCCALLNSNTKSVVQYKCEHDCNLHPQQYHPYTSSTNPIKMILHPSTTATTIVYYHPYHVISELQASPFPLFLQRPTLHSPYPVPPLCTIEDATVSGKVDCGLVAFSERRPC